MIPRWRGSCGWSNRHSKANPRRNCWPTGQPVGSSISPWAWQSSPPSPGSLAVGFNVEVIGRVATVLVIACPHALGLAVPLVVAISTSLAARNGILVRDRLALEEARQIDTVIFDKTGTLTKGEFGVVGQTTRRGLERGRRVGADRRHRRRLRAHHRPRHSQFGRGARAVAARRSPGSRPSRGAA